MFTPTPPEESLCALPIIRCLGRGYLDVIVVTEKYTGVMTHWIDDATALHTTVVACPGCEANQAPRWQGFAIVQSTESGYHRLLQFTPPVARVLDAHRAKSDSLCGVTARLHRSGSNRNSPLHAEVIDYAEDKPHFSHKQLEEAVARLFRAVGPIFGTSSAALRRSPTD